MAHMDSALGLLAFLARSENRVRTLSALACGSATRAELQAETGVPRATLSRALADFRDRELATRTGHEYAVTPLGALFAAELSSLLEAIEVGADLQALGPWLPLDELGIDVGALADADVTLPTTLEPLAPVRRAAAVVAESERVRGLCNNVLPAVLRSLKRAVEAGRIRVDVTVTADAFEAVAADPDGGTVLRDLLGSGRVDIAIHDGQIPVLALVADETVLFAVTDEAGVIRGLVESQNPAVRSWFDTTYEAFRQASDRVALEALSA